jgi:hypothetical protein
MVATGSDIIQKYSDLNSDFNGYEYSDLDIFRYGYFFDGYGYGYGMEFETGSGSFKISDIRDFEIYI